MPEVFGNETRTADTHARDKTQIFTVIAIESGGAMLYTAYSETKVSQTVLRTL